LSRSFRVSSMCRLSCAWGSSQVQKTPLDAIHRELGAKMGEFCGWDMPFSYPSLSSTESHMHTREKASLFDVSHMLRLHVEGKDAAAFLERVFVVDLEKLDVDQGAYTLLMNEEGGVKDDAILTRCQDYFYLVLNAACADKDLAYLQEQQAKFGGDVRFVKRDGALVAVQGPQAEEALKSLADQADIIEGLQFMDTRADVKLAGVPCRVTRCGYTGEDGFEVEIIDQIDTVVRALLKDERVEPAGLIARDTLRLEAGLALYGNDLMEERSPIESALNWTISKRRRANGDFLGADRVLRDLKDGVDEKRVGVTAPPGRLLRPGMAVLKGDEQIGSLCSGGFSPCLKHPLGMAYVSKAHSKIGTELEVQAGKTKIPVTVAKMPFVPTNYKGTKKE